MLFSGFYNFGEINIGCLWQPILSPNIQTHNAQYSHQDHPSIQNMQGFSGHFHPKSFNIALFGEWLFDYN